MQKKYIRLYLTTHNGLKVLGIHLNIFETFLKRFYDFQTFSQKHHPHKMVTIDIFLKF